MPPFSLFEEFKAILGGGKKTAAPAVPAAAPSPSSVQDAINKALGPSAKAQGPMAKPGPAPPAAPATPPVKTSNVAAGGFADPQLQAALQKLKNAKPSPAANPLDPYMGQAPSHVPPNVWMKATQVQKQAMADAYNAAPVPKPPAQGTPIPPSAPSWFQALQAEEPRPAPAAAVKQSASQAALTNPATYQQDAVNWYAGVAWKAAPGGVPDALANLHSMSKGMPPDFVAAIAKQIKQGKQANPPPTNPNKPGQSQMTPAQGQAWTQAFLNQPAGAGNNPAAVAAREKNRIKGRFTTPAYHGQAAPTTTYQKLMDNSVSTDQGWRAYIEPHSPSGKKRFAAAQPELSELYAPGNVKKYFLNTNDYHMFNAQGQSWGAIGNKAIVEATQAGKKGIIVHNVADEPNLTMNQLGPQTTYVVFDMSTARSESAQFDPAKWHLPDLMASGAAIGLASGIPGLTDRAEAAPIPKKITLFHASPEEFTKFDPAKGGSGVGRAEFSEGTYLAGNPDTMEHYARRFEAERGKAVRYEVDASVDQNQLLDFDKPFAQQTEQVRQALERAGIGNLDERRAQALGGIGDPSVRYLSGDESAKLKELGVQGVRYLDKGSRGSGGGSSTSPERLPKDQTHNYVMWDPATLSIVKKYGIGALITGAAAGLASEDQAQAAEPSTGKPGVGMQQLMDSVLNPAKAAGVSPVHDAINRALAGAPSTSAQGHEGLERVKDIPGDIAGVFGEGVETLKGAAAAQRGRAPVGATRDPWRKGAGQEGGLGEFMSILGGAWDVSGIGTVLEGAKRSLVDRPIAEHAERQDVPASQRQQKSGWIKDAFTGATPRYRFHEARPASPEAVKDVGQLTSLALPGVGIVPYAKMGKLFARAPNPIKDFTTQIGDDLFRLRQTTTADKAELKERMAQALQSAGLKPGEPRTQQIQEIIYNLIERRTVANLPADQQAFLQDPDNLATVTNMVKAQAPFRLELSNLYNRLRNLGIPDTDLVDPDYVHRRVVGHDPTLDPAASQGGLPTNPVGFVGTQSLPKTTSALQSRKMMGGEAADGSRVVISEDDAGNWQVHTGATTVSHAVPHPTQPDAFLFNGKTYQVGQATSLEIESATAHEPSPVKYYKNALVNTVDALQRMRAVARHLEWLESLKQTPEFKQWARFGKMSPTGMTKPKGIPDDWEQSTLPTMKGWYMEPQMRAAFDDFYHPGGGPNALLDALRKVNQFATASLFWQPVTHAMNAGGHWFVSRGWDWIRPAGVKSLAVDGWTAMRSVATQDANYRRLLKNGSGMLFGGVKNADFYRDIAKMAGMDIKRNPARWDPIARTIGIGPSDLVKAIYSGSSNALWWASDVFMMQRVLELERKGMTTARAVKEAEKHNINYRIPTEIMGSRLFSQFMQDPAFTVFSRYHYGMFNAFAHTVRDLVGPMRSPQERIEAIGNLMALAMLTWVVYPLVIQPAMQKMLGDEDVKVNPRGPATVPTALVDLYEGDKRWEQIIGEAIMLPAALKGAVTALGGGNDPFTGQPITEPRSSAGAQVAQGAGWLAGQMVQPMQLINKRPEAEGGNTPVRTVLNQVLGLADTSEAAQKSRRLRKKMELKRARKREAHPRGVIERLYGGTD